MTNEELMAELAALRADVDELKAAAKSGPVNVSFGRGLVVGDEKTLASKMETILDDAGQAPADL